MDLFCFASRNMENIWIGVQARKWAVATVSDRQMKDRRTKAERYLCPGSLGLLYCSSTQSFTVPFIVKSKVNLFDKIKDVWPETWELPFDIQPLGIPDRQVSADKAWNRWPILQKRKTQIGGVTAALNITGTTVFVPNYISDKDWQVILEDLVMATLLTDG